MKTTWFLAALIITGLSSLCLAYSGGDGTAGNPYQINSLVDWQTLMSVPLDWNSSFILTADIDLQGVTVTPVGNLVNGPFMGSFNGNGYVVQNAVINLPGGSCVGLFGCTGADSQIYDLGMKSANIIGGYAVGSLIGINFGGNVNTCYTTGTILVSGFESGYAGGFIGYNAEGTVNNCYTTTSISGDGHGQTGPIGGFIGFTDQGAINNCYAAGPVSVGFDSGGLIGDNLDTEVTGCFWNTQTSGQTTSAGGTGKTLMEMRTLATFTSAGWDFTNEAANGTHDYWRMCADGVFYPRPSWITSSMGDFACPDGTDMQDLIVLAQNWLTSELVNPATFNYACDANGDGRINQEDFNRLSQSWPGENFVQSSTVGECVMDSNSSQAQTSGLFSESLRFNVTVQGQMILFEDVVNTNCCKDDILLKATVGSGQILLKEQVKLGSMCMCNCDFPVEAEIGPFEPGQYTFTVVQSENNESGQLIGEVSVVIE